MKAVWKTGYFRSMMNANIKRIPVSRKQVQSLPPLIEPYINTLQKLTEIYPDVFYHPYYSFSWFFYQELKRVSFSGEMFKLLFSTLLKCTENRIVDKLIKCMLQLNSQSGAIVLADCSKYTFSPISKHMCRSIQPMHRGIYNRTFVKTKNWAIEVNLSLNLFMWWPGRESNPWCRRERAES